MNSQEMTQAVNHMAARLVEIVDNLTCNEPGENAENIRGLAKEAKVFRGMLPKGSDQQTAFDIVMVVVVEMVMAEQQRQQQTHIANCPGCQFAQILESRGFAVSGFMSH